MIEGQEIEEIWSLGSGYSANMVALKKGDKVYRMNIKEILKFINDVKFTEVEKRVHTHLEGIEK